MPDKKPLDGLLDEAKVLSQTGFVHADIEIGHYGWSLVVRDKEPIDTYDWNDVLEVGDDLPDKVHVGKIITAGMGRTLDEAIQAANAGLAPRG